MDQSGAEWSQDVELNRLKLRFKKNEEELLKNAAELKKVEELLKNRSNT